MCLVGMEDINTGNKLQQRLHTKAQELGIQDNYYIQAATAEGALKISSMHQMAKQLHAAAEALW